MAFRNKTPQQIGRTKNWIISIPVLILSLIFGGCQQESDVITQPQPEEAILANSVVAQLMQRTALKDGSDDNILDQSSCTTLQLPITVIVNGQEIQINTENDYDEVEKILDEFEDDEDTVFFIFPVTLIREDYTTLQINSEDELEDIIEQCTEGLEDDDIECIDFQYPLTFYVYDSDNQVSDVTTIDSDEDLFQFLENLDNGHLVSLVFPVTLFLSGEQEVIVNDNSELEDAIEGAIDECDEDDDNDYNDDDVDDTALVAALTDGVWEITYFFDDTDRTGTFQGYVFTFNEDGTALAANGLSESSGSWKTYGDDGFLEIELNFGEEGPFGVIQEDWELVQFTNSRIELKEDREDSASTTALVFEKK